MEFCLICKEMIGNRYSVQVKDTEHDNKVEGHVCKDCWQSFISSSSDKGQFGIMKFASWIKGDRDSKRF